jgi:hypothetical protein
MGCVDVHALLGEEGVVGFTGTWRSTTGEGGESGVCVHAFDEWVIGLFTVYHEVSGWWYYSTSSNFYGNPLS